MEYVSPSASSLPSTPSLTMSTAAAAAPPRARGIDFSLPTCGEIQCNDHGACVVAPGGGGDLVCECELGYRGMFCDDTVNGALSVPLTVSVLAVIIGLLIVAFLFAKLRQKQKKRHRKHLAEKRSYKVTV